LANLEKVSERRG